MIIRYYKVFSLFLFLTLNLFAQDIHELARNGSVAEVREFLIKEPEAINKLSDRGISPFILACYRGNNEVAKFLMNKGADVNVCTSEGSALYGIIFISPNDTCQFRQFGTPLHMAMSLKRYDMVELLLNSGASKSIPNQEGMSIDELLIRYNDESLTKIFKRHEKN
jgi:ankyrin repeat protein